MEVKLGVTRYVFVLKNCVIKIPSLHSWKSFLQGLLANIKESEWACLDDIRMAKTRYSSPFGLFNVMEKVDPLPKNFKQKHLDFLLANGRFDGLPQDFHLGNFGVRGRRIVLLDYGS